jgi:PH domain
VTLLESGANRVIQYWRRRFFRLQGPKLTAYHEVTRQPRATINLAKAAKLIDDKSSLTQKETTTRGGGRRKSAFSEEEEGYMFVEEGFRIRFANGEVIDFYADSRSEKDGWMKVLSETVGKGYSAGAGQVKPWTELVFKHERNANAKRDALDRLMTANGQPALQKELPSPTKSTAQPPFQPPTRPRHQHNMSQPEVRSPESRREKTRSLMF